MLNAALPSQKLRTSYSHLSIRLKDCEYAAQVTYESEKGHYLAYLKPRMASDAYAYGLSAANRKRYIADKQDEIVQRWLEAASPPIISSVAQASLPPPRDCGKMSVS